VRLSDLPRTTSFRLALLFLLLFGAASITLFGFLEWRTGDYLINRVDDWLQREQASFTRLGREEVLDRVTAHATGNPSLDRLFILFNPTGQRIAGSPLSIPASTLASLPHNRPFDLMLSQSGKPMPLRGQIHRMPPGELLFIAEDMTNALHFRELLTEAFISGGLITTMLGLFGAAIAGADAVRRIDAVTRATQRIMHGDFSGRLPTRGRTGDLDRLIHVINSMLDEIERLMHEVKGVCDNIAHDLRTPLTRLLAGLERARRRATSAEDYGIAVDEAIRETRGLLTTFAAILRISEAESGARRAGFTVVDLSQVAADAVEFYEPMAEERGATLQLTSDGTTAALMQGDPSLLFEAIGNLVDNALKFTPAGGHVVVRTFAAANRLGIEVTDTGSGIPHSEREAVLWRFYRAEESRHTAGSGLGLALVAAVTRLHEMDLTITDANPGCRITLMGPNTRGHTAAMSPHMQRMATQRR